MVGVVRVVLVDRSVRGIGGFGWIGRFRGLGWLVWFGRFGWIGRCRGL